MLNGNQVAGRIKVANKLALQQRNYSWVIQVGSKYLS